MTDEDGTPRPDPRQEPNPEPASDASGPKGDGARHPRISRFVGSRPLGKAIDLDIINNERALIKTPLTQSVRHVQTIEVATAEALAEVVRTCATDEALALGVCGREQAHIVVADKLTPELRAKGVVARTDWRRSARERRRTRDAGHGRCRGTSHQVRSACSPSRPSR